MFESLRLAIARLWATVLGESGGSPIYLREYLDEQSNLIERVFDKHKMGIKVDGGNLTAWSIRFHLATSQSLRSGQLTKLLPELTRELGVESVMYQLDPVSRKLFLEVPRPDPIDMPLTDIGSKVPSSITSSEDDLPLPVATGSSWLPLSALDFDVVGGDQSSEQAPFEADTKPHQHSTSKTQTVSKDDRTSSDLAINAMESPVVYNSTPANRDQVFISYSHKDKRWLDALQTALRPFIRQELFDVWDDTRIKAGQKWHSEIRGALSRAKVAVLLVSSNFLASEFIAANELPPLLKAAETEGLTILWIAISSSAYRITPLAEYQAANNPARPLDILNPAIRNREFVSICEQIHKAALGQ